MSTHTFIIVLRGSWLDGLIKYFREVWVELVKLIYIYKQGSCVISLAFLLLAIFKSAFDFLTQIGMLTGHINTCPHYSTLTN